MNIKIKWEMKDHKRYATWNYSILKRTLSFLFTDSNQGTIACRESLAS